MKVGMVRITPMPSTHTYLVETYAPGGYSLKDKEVKNVAYYLLPDRSVVVSLRSENYTQQDEFSVPMGHIRYDEEENCWVIEDSRFTETRETIEKRELEIYLSPAEWDRLEDRIIGTDTTMGELIAGIVRCEIKGHKI